MRACWFVLLGLACHSAAVLAQGPVPLVSVAPVVEERDAAAGHFFVGTVHPVRRSVIGSSLDGRIETFSINAGDAVKAKQPLAKLLSRQIEIQIAAAKADLKLRDEELRELKNGARPEELREAKAKTAAAKALHDYMQARLQRAKSLYERNAKSDDELEDDIQKAIAATNAYEALRATEEMLVIGPRAEKIAQADARVATATEEVNRLEDLLVKHTVISPFDGYVVAEHTEVGQWIKSGELVAEVEDLSEVEIEAQVLENYLDYVRIGTPARIEITALPNESFVGQVTTIVPRADERSRNFPVKIRLANKIDADGVPVLKSGMFARIWLPVEKRQAVLLVPNDAVVMGGPQPVVFVAQRSQAGGETAVVRAETVQLGAAFGTALEVMGANLAAGQEVVIEGNERLFPGQTVKIVPASRGGQPPAAPAGK